MNLSIILPFYHKLEEFKYTLPYNKQFFDIQQQFLEHETNGYYGSICVSKKYLKIIYGYNEY
jgi:hypothetical protein